MMSKDRPYIPFSQREGLEPIPSQLQLGEVSDELRRLLGYYIKLEIEREERSGYNHAYFNGKWLRVTMDFHVLLLGQKAGIYKNSPYEFQKLVQTYTAKANIGKLFDFVEFFVRHPGCSSELKAELAGAFETVRAAYRIVDNQIIAIGTEQQAEAFSAAISGTEIEGADPVRGHLVAAGGELRAGNWAGSVRESIHAVEAMALRLAPGAKTLGSALTELEKGGHLHGGLKSAFGALYGYSSDEEGVRHALVFREEARVDEADALFMLGACASFVSYLIARNTLR